MSTSFADRIGRTGPIPLAWAGSTSEMDYLNVGDALSPVMVALMAGRGVTRIPTKSKTLRMAAVGTIGHGFADGEVWFWGTGCSNSGNPSAPKDKRVPFVPTPESKFVVKATRGPVSERLLAGPDGDKPGVYGDPVWLLPHFHRPKVEKKWKLGVILHLSELADRTYEARPRDGFKRFLVPKWIADDVRLITTVAPISMEAIGDKIDEILACRRIVSTSLHGMVIAESYGIPCLYFAPHGPGPGLQTVKLDPPGDLDLRIVDLYRGLGRETLDVWVQPRAERTRWPVLIDAIDQAWKPIECDEDALMRAFPLDYAPLAAAPGETIWQHPVLRGLTLQHDVAALRRADAATGGSAVAAPPVVGKTTMPLDEADPSVPLSWVASTPTIPWANLGDALSAVVISALSGRPVRHIAFDSPVERLIGVGTIAQAQRNGHLHMWGTGLDATRNPVDPSIGRYTAPPDTSFHVHATRGPNSAAVLRGVGIEAPHVYGDPVWLLPRIWPCADVEKTHDLGVIVHITELEDHRPGAAVREALKRYRIPPSLAGSVRVIDTLTEPTFEALEAKVREIVACRAILSTSLHGLVIAETYGIPCAWFGPRGPGVGRRLRLGDASAPMDHRMRDFYSAARTTTLLAYCGNRGDETDWERAIAFVGSAWKPLAYSPDALLEAFPLTLAAPDAAGLWRPSEEARATFRF